MPEQKWMNVKLQTHPSCDKNTETIATRSHFLGQRCGLLEFKNNVQFPHLVTRTGPSLLGNHLDGV
jgi:hypothetical protein